MSSPAPHPPCPARARHRVFEPPGVGGRTVRSRWPGRGVVRRGRSSLRRRAHRRDAATVDYGDRIAVTGSGDRLEYDALVVAVGARTRAPCCPARSVRRPADVPALARRARRGRRAASCAARVRASARRGWTLPVYELAIMAAVELRDRGAERRAITVVTPEPRRCGCSARRRPRRSRELLADARHRGCGRGRAPPRSTPASSSSRTATRLPPTPSSRSRALAGPGDRPGCPPTTHGFMPVDAHGRVRRAPGRLRRRRRDGVPAQAGRARHPAGRRRRGGDRRRARRAGRRRAPFRPVLRGLLLTGGAPLYLRRAEPAGERREPRRAGCARLARRDLARALWWPPGKIAGRYLAPLARDGAARRARDASRSRTVGGAARAPPTTRRCARAGAAARRRGRARRATSRRRCTRSTRRPRSAAACYPPSGAQTRRVARGTTSVVARSSSDLRSPRGNQRRRTVARTDQRAVH